MPWRCAQARYCSAFPDTDAPFGSAGNFFSAPLHLLAPPLVSAECGPPYDDEARHLVQRGGGRGIGAREEMRRHLLP